MRLCWTCARQIKLLTERMSAMEDEQRRVRAYMHNLEVCIRASGLRDVSLSLT